MNKRLVIGFAGALVAGGVIGNTLPPAGNAFRHVAKWFERAPKPVVQAAPAPKQMTAEETTAQKMLDLTTDLINGSEDGKAPLTAKELDAKAKELAALQKENKGNEAVGAAVKSMRKSDYPQQQALLEAYAKSVGEGKATNEGFRRFIAAQREKVMNKLSGTYGAANSYAATIESDYFEKMEVTVVVKDGAVESVTAKGAGVPKNAAERLEAVYAKQYTDKRKLPVDGVFSFSVDGEKPE